MYKLLRLSYLILALFLIAVGMALISQNLWLENHWLWPHAPWISDFFMASLFFANAFALIYCAFTKELRAIVPVAIGGLACFAGSGLYFLLEAHATNYYLPKTSLLSWGNISILYVVFYSMFLLIAWKVPFLKTTRLPTSLQFCLGLIVMINLWVGLRLIGHADAFAWQL